MQSLIYLFIQVIYLLANHATKHLSRAALLPSSASAAMLFYLWAFSAYC